MNRFPVAAALIGIACAWQGAGGAQVSSGVLLPVVIHEEFDGEGLGQWASYPPAQDVGYEPSLAPTAEYDAPGGRALMRTVTPVTTAPLLIGFIKKMQLVSSSGAQLAFSYRLEPPVLAGAIEVGLAGGDGHRYTARLSATSGAWTSTVTNLSDFRDAKGRRLIDNTTLEAVYVVAEIADARREITSRFLLDNVRLSASRTAGFDVQLPSATRLEPWTALASSTVLRAGSTIDIAAAAPMPLKHANWALTGASGQPIARGMLHDDGSAGDRKASDNVWSQAAAHRVAERDQRGIWHLELDGETTDGRRIDTELRLLVLPRRLLPHPRLYFDGASTQQLRARRNDPASSDLWETLQKSATSSRATGAIAHGGEVFARLDSTYLLPSLLGYFDVLNRARLRISSNAAVGFIDDDRLAREAARTALLEVSRWKTWTPPWFAAHGQHTYYPAGQLAAAVALAYDLLYEDLSEAERQLVRRALMERSILPTWREYVLDNRVMAGTSNWIAHTVGGAIIAAAAISGDGSAGEDEALALPLDGLLMKIESHMAASFLPDGSYGEGISYLEFDLETLGPMLWAVERVFGQSYWDSTNVVESLRYPLHTLAEPVNESFDMGDTHPPAGHALGPIVARSKDPVIRWYGSLFKRTTITDFLIFDDSVRPRAPSASGSRIFSDKGNAVFRTGWDAEAGLVLFRAGPTFNHNHADQGSFQFRAFGETLVSEAGWSDYYKDPYYDTFFTQAAGHNTLLVDGDPASQDIADTAQFAALNRRPRITDSTLSPFYDAVGSDLAPVYRGRLETYTRRLAYMKPNYLVVFDRVRAGARPARFTWRLHVAEKAGLRVQTTGAGSVAQYAGAKAALAIRPITSAPVHSTVGDGHIPFPVFAARTPEDVPPQPAYLDLTTDAPAQDAWFLVALVPGRDAAGAEAAAAAMRPLAAPGWSGFETTRQTEHDVVLFSTGSASRETPLRGWLSDAETVSATLRGSDLWRVGAQQVRTLRHDGRLLVEADRPVNLALEYGDASITGTVAADRQARVRLGVPRAPARVTVDGAVAEISYDASTASVALNIAAPSRTVVISWTNDR